MCMMVCYNDVLPLQLPLTPSSLQEALVCLIVIILVPSNLLQRVLMTLPMPLYSRLVYISNVLENKGQDK